jgi:ferredoxin
MALFSKTGGQAFMEKGWGTLQVEEKEPTTYALTVMIHTSRNLNRSSLSLPLTDRRMETMLNKRYTRREFIRNLSLTTLAGLSLPLLSSCTKEEAEDFLQKHFHEMTEEEKKRVIANLEQRYLQKYGRKFQISTKEAVPDTLWAYGLELSRCIGCRRCVYACVKENNSSRHNPQLQWIRVLRLKRGNLINLENSEHYYDPDLVPEKGFIYLPVQCQQCQNPPCVKVCPVHRVQVLYCSLPL